MKRAVIDYSRAWWKSVEDEDFEWKGDAKLEDGVRQAWGKLRADPAQVTMMLEQGLAEIVRHRDYADAWVGHMRTLGMPEGWAKAVYEKQGFASEEAIRSKVTMEDQTEQTIRDSVLAKEVRVDVKQGDRPLLLFVGEFRRRAALAGLPRGKWLATFEALLNERSRGMFWIAYNEADEFDEVVGRMLRQDPDCDEITARLELDRLVQRRGETAHEFFRRLQDAVDKVKYTTGKAPETSLKTLFLTKLYLGRQVQLLVRETDDIQETVRIAAVYQETSRGKDNGPGGQNKKMEVRSGRRNAMRWKEEDRVLKGQTRDQAAAKCFRCGKSGHFKRDCPESAAVTRAQRQAKECDPWMDGVVSCRGAKNKVRVLVDTGAFVSVAKRDVVADGVPADGEIEFYWGREHVRSEESYEVQLSVGRSTFETLRMWVVDETFLGPADVILSGEDARRLGYALRWGEQKVDDEMNRLSGDEEEPVEWSPGPIQVDGDMTEVVQRAVKNLPLAESLMDLQEPAKVGVASFEWKVDMPEEIPVIRRRLSPGEMKLLREREKELVESGIYVPGDSSFASPWMVVAKPKGGLRDVVDMRKVNEYMLGSSWPLTDLEDVKVALGGYAVYAELDLKAAYWQIPLRKEDQKKCAIVGVGRLLLPTRLPMGARDSGSQLERLVKEALRLPDEKWKAGESIHAGAELYRDNLYIGAKDENHLAKALDKLGKLAKSGNLRFGSGTVGKVVNIMGYQVSEENWKPMEKALASILAFPTPHNKRSVRSFLGKTNYYRELVPGYADIAGPMEKLTGKTEWCWGAEEQTSFERLKEMLTKSATVASWKKGQPTEIRVDASDKALGAVLMQDGKVCGHYSRRLKGSQLKWSVTRKEARALVEAVKLWRHKLSSSTVVRTDHQALEGWARGGGEGDDAVMTRWALWLQSQPIRVEWTPGSSNGIADQASRVMAQRWEDLTPLLDPGSTDRRARRYSRQNGDELYYGSKKVPVLEGGARKDWLRELHVELGHPGKTATKEAMRAQGLGWETMEAEILEVVETCDSCQRGESRNPEPKSDRLPGRRADWKVGDEWSVDLLVELPETERGHRHLLVATEAVSGYVEAYPLVEKSSSEVAICLQEMFWRYGFPRRLRSDRGTEFEGDVAALCERAGITQKKTSGYHPQGNGQAERKNRDVVDRLTRSGEDMEWDLRIGATLWALRVAPSRRLGGRSSMEVMYGEPPRIPSFVRVIGEVEDPTHPEETEELVRRQLQSREALRKEVSEALRSYEGAGTRWKPGDLVMVRNHRRRKFEPRWVGPAVVVHARDTGLTVKMETGNERVVNNSDVKRYRAELGMTDQGSDVEDGESVPPVLQV